MTKSPKTLLISASQSLLLTSKTKTPKISHFHIRHLSSSSSSSRSFPPYPSRRQEEESRLVRVSVWWDFENCQLPVDASAYRVSQTITAAIRANGIKGPIQITAFGDVMQISRLNQEVLTSTGVNIIHVPNGGKNSADRALLVDLMYWVSQNPPPAHLFLISSDRDFANILHRLRLNNYNILLSSHDSAPGVLCSAASIMWQWNALVRGENLNGRHFNQPPDGPFGSWYGHYRLPLEDPFAVSEQAHAACLGDENSSRLVSEHKVRSVPEVVMNQICRIVSYYPDGISIGDLRDELTKTGVIIPKDFYGHKKFSQLLLSMPHILHLKSLGDGVFLVHKVLDSVEASPGIRSGIASRNGVPNPAISAKRCGSEEKSLSPSSPNVNARKPLRNIQESPKQVEEPLENVIASPPFVMKEKNAEVVGTSLEKLPKSKKLEEAVNVVPNVPPFIGMANDAEKNHLYSVKEQDLQPKVGYLRNIQKKRICDKDSGSEDSKYGNAAGLGSNSSFTDETIVDENVSRSSEANAERSSTDPGFFKRIIRWFKFWSSTKSDNANELSSDPMSLIKGDAEVHHVFSTESFWDEIVEFIDTRRGSDLIVSSKTRIEMAQNLQKEGPSVLGILDEGDLRHLVNLLISDKKWVEECPSEKFPFKLTLPTKKSFLSDNPTSNVLSSTFLNTQSKSKSQSSLKHRDKKNQTPPGTVSSKSSSEVLADCQKLVDYIVKKYPEGFSIGSFRKLFLERYGYYLDEQKIGYQNLVSVLQMMSGVKIETTYIVPVDPSGKIQKRHGIEVTEPSVEGKNVGGKTTKYDNNLVDTSSGNPDSPWEELGPVTRENPKGKEMEGSRRKVRETTYEYETLSDDDFSDSDDGGLSSMGSAGHCKPRANGEESSLLQILDSWHRSKEKEGSSNQEDDCRKVASENIDGMGDCSIKATTQSSSSGVVVRSNTAEGSCARKRPSKSYSFVSDQVGNGKDKLIDGILGSLKKSGERSTETRVQA